MSRTAFNPPRQMPLAVALRDDASFDNFTTGHNAPLVACLRSIGGAEGEPLVYLWGAPGCGKTHLLQAVCHEVRAPRQALYLPLTMRDELSPEVFEGLEQCAVVCVDDLDVIAGDRVWEEAFFNAFNRMRSFGTVLVVAANASPHGLAWALPDVASRMAWGATWNVESLDDEAKEEALVGRARSRGIHMPQPVLRYIMRRFARDPASLFGLLDRLDAATLAEKKALTVPFVKALIEAEE